MSIFVEPIKGELDNFVRQTFRRTMAYCKRGLPALGSLTWPDVFVAVIIASLCSLFASSLTDEARKAFHLPILIPSLITGTSIPVRLVIVLGTPISIVLMGLALFAVDLFLFRRVLSRELMPVLAYSAVLLVLGFSLLQYPIYWTFVLIGAWNLEPRQLFQAIRTDDTRLLVVSSHLAVGLLLIATARARDLSAYCHKAFKVSFIRTIAAFIATCVLSLLLLLLPRIEDGINGIYAGRLTARMGWQVCILDFVFDQTKSSGAAEFQRGVIEHHGALRKADPAYYGPKEELLEAISLINSEYLAKRPMDKDKLITYMEISSSYAATLLPGFDDPAPKCDVLIPYKDLLWERIATRLYGIFA